jgi:signal transduction histidine kinase
VKGMIFKTPSQWVTRGIRRRLLALGLALLALMLFSYTIANTIYSRGRVRIAQSQIQMEVATRVASEIEGFVQGKVTRLRDLASAVSLYDPGVVEQRLLGLLLLKNDAAFTEIAVLDATGKETAKISERKVYLPSDLAERSDTAVFTRSVQGDTYIGPVYTSDRAEPYITVGVPIQLRPRQVIGVLRGEINLKFLWQAVGEIKFGKAGYAYVVDRGGGLIAHKDASLVLSQQDLAHVYGVRKFLESGGAIDRNPAGEGEGLRGEPVLSTFVPVSGLDWAVVLEERAAVALADLKRLERYTLFLLVAGLFIGGGVIVWASDKIARPIRELHRGAEIIAAGNLQHRVAVETHDEIADLGQQFNRMAAELQNSYAALEERVAQRTRDLSVLYEITAAVNQSIELEPILQVVVRKITDIFCSDATRIFLFDHGGNNVELQASFDTRPEFRLGVRSFKRGQGIVGRVAETAEPLVFENTLTDPRYQAYSESRAMRKAGYCFLAAFPIKARERCLGTLLLVGQFPRKFVLDEARLITSVAEQIGVAVENAELFRAVKAKSQELATLMEINKDLNREVLLPRIVYEARHILNVDTSIFRLVEGENLVLLSASEPAQDFSVQPKLSIHEGLTGEVVSQNRVVAVKKLLENNKLSEWQREALGRAGYRSFLGIPMRVADRIIGTLTVFSVEEREFQAEEILLMSAFADQAAIAIENANLFAEVKAKSVELEKANRELVEASRTRSGFMAAMSHELRTPLNVIIGNTELVQDGFFGDVTPKQREALDNVLRYSQILLKLIHNVLAMTRLEAKGMTMDVSTFHLEEIIGQVQTYAEHLNYNNKVELRWQVEKNLPPLTTDALKLEEILQNLLGNAFKFTPRGGIEVGVRDLPAEGRIEFRVSDTGIGIEADVLDRIFEEFYQHKEAHTGTYSGVGLGLSIVKKYLDLMGGDIRVESQPQEGSTFTITLPYTV